jgi:hypothetical protein
MSVCMWKEPIGDGGCSAYAIARIVNSHQATIAMELNAAAEQIYEKRLVHDNPQFPKTKVYCKDQRWCPEAISIVLGKRGFTIKNVNVHKHRRAILSYQHGKLKSYLVEGLLAKHFCKSLKGGKSKMVETDPNDDTSPNTHPKLWRHTVAVKKGMVLDLFNLDDDMVACDLVRDAKPYLLRIFKVWHISRSTKL